MVIQVLAPAQSHRLLECAWLYACNLLECAWLYACNLERAKLYACNLKLAWLYACNLAHQSTRLLTSLPSGLEQYDCTALFWASDKGHMDIVRALLAAGADVNRADKVSWVLFCLAPL